MSEPLLFRMRKGNRREPPKKAELNWRQRFRVVFIFSEPAFALEGAVRRTATAGMFTLVVGVLRW